MSLYRHILAGTDFSSQAEVAINKSIFLAMKYSARLSMVHILDERINQYQDILPLSPGELEEMLLQELRRKLMNFSHNSVNNSELMTLACEAHALFGQPSQELMRYSKREDVDLIVLGQQGSTTLRHLLLGSTIERILRHSRVPVLITRGTRSAEFQQIMVAVDFSETSRKALFHAISLAREDGAELHILHVCEEPPLNTLLALFPRRSAEEFSTEFVERTKKEFHIFLEGIDFQGLEYQTHFHKGSPATEINICAEKIGCDLAVIGSIGRTGVRGMLIGNTAERVARMLHCSLLVIKH